MKTSTLEPVVRMMVREAALGFDDHEIVLNHPEYSVEQVRKIRAGSTFCRAVREMQEQIDQELVESAASDPVKQYMKGKALSASKVLVSLAENHDGGTPHAVQAKAADSILTKAGYGTPKENVVVPILMLSPAKLEAVQGSKRAEGVVEIPDYVDGHTQRLVT